MFESVRGYRKTLKPPSSAAGKVPRMGYAAESIF